MGVIACALALACIPGCFGPGEDELVFIETQDANPAVTEAPVQSLAPVVKDQVSLQESQLPPIRVCVLPFRNVSGQDNLDYYTFALGEIFNESLSERTRFSQSMVMSEENYLSMLEEMGYRQIVPPNQQIASYLKRDKQVDYIVHGKIDLVDDNPVIQPYVIEIPENGGEYSENVMESMILKLNNFLDINPFVMNIISSIDAMADTRQ